MAAGRVAFFVGANMGEYDESKIRRFAAGFADGRRFRELERKKNLTADKRG
jgi:hypothetical protein